MLTRKFIDDICQQLLRSLALQCKTLTYFKSIKYDFNRFIKRLAKVCRILLEKSNVKLPTNGTFNITKLSDSSLFIISLFGLEFR